MDLSTEVVFTLNGKFHNTFWKAWHSYKHVSEFGRRKFVAFSISWIIFLKNRCCVRRSQTTVNKYIEKLVRRGLIDRRD